MSRFVDVTQASNDEVASLRSRYCREMNCQIVHHSLHRRPGWTTRHLLSIDGRPAGFGSLAIGGPWTDKPTLCEFYVLPEFRMRAFDMFESLLVVTDAKYLEIQSNDRLFCVMCHAYARDVVSEAIVFEDAETTAFPGCGASLRPITSDEEVEKCIRARQGGGEWQLELDGTIVGTGGILFHYNVPFGDVYMEVSESFRRRGLGSYLVQELKRLTYLYGAVPGARCNTTNTASRRTLQKAGFIPYAHILTGRIERR